MNAIEPTPDHGPRPSVALAHDYLLVMRGAERTFAAMAGCWPGAPIHTLLCDPGVVEAAFKGHPVFTSLLQRLGVRQKGFRRLLPLFPAAMDRLDVGDPDLVVSSSSAFAHGITVPEGVPHVSYCHSPFRYAWHENERAVAEVPRSLRPAVRRVLGRARRWDREAATRVTHYVTNSRLSQSRILRFWGREASIVHPPVAVERFSVAVPEDFLLVVTELVGHKRVELALAAARRAGRPIKVVGTGPDLERLRSEYAGSAEFLGRLDDRSLAQVYSRALALVVPNVEDFGIAAVEAQASGRPVVAAGAGGALETVIDGVTGVHVRPESVDALADAMATTDFETFSPDRIRSHAETFSTEAFQRNLLATVREVTQAGPDDARGETDAGRSPGEVSR